MTPKTKKINEPLDFALIGCGGIAQTHLQAIAELSETQLVAVADVNEKAAQDVADQHKCSALKDYRRLLNGKKIDAVVICTPPSTHAEIANFFLKKGIHVLCEKPLAVNSKQAKQMVKAAEENDCLLMMASKFRYVEDIIWAKSLIASGILGDIVLFENVFCSHVDMNDRWNSNKKIAGGGVLIDNGSHSIDIARFLLGPLVKVQAEKGRSVQGLEVEDTAHIYFKTHLDTQGVIDLSWSIHKERDSYVEIFGTEGALSIGWKTSKYRQSETLHWVDFGTGYDKLGAFKRQLENFVATIKGREKPLITSVDGLESVRVIEAAYKSMDKDKWVTVDSESMNVARKDAQSFSTSAAALSIQQMALIL
jgi:predicted dehydrogenase